MISFFLSPYSGSFQNQLNFIEENAWMFHITKLYIEDNFFSDIIDLKYYPIFLKKKENIDMIFIPKIDNKIYNVNSTNDLVSMYCSHLNYFIDFESFIKFFSPTSKQIIQIINRYNFKKEVNTINYLLFTFETQFTKYIIYKTNDYYLNLHFNYKSILHHCNFDGKILGPNGYIFAIEKIENNDNYNNK